MVFIRSFLLLGVLFVRNITAAPTPGLVDGLLTGIADTAAVKDASTVLAQLLGTHPATAAPASADQLRSTLSSIWGNEKSPNGFYNKVLVQVEANILPSGLLTSLANLVGPTSGIDSTVNANLHKPSSPIYPHKSSADAPYSLLEAQLRAAIYIPSTFTYGKKPPTILVPGTGVYGGETFSSNLAKLLTGKSYADPVWLNVPGALLGDAQVNSEYVAYAINYISSISKNAKVSVISWSQGGLDTQWAFAFWPSTRSVVSDFLPVSPDFHGTVVANALCLSEHSVTGFDPCDPSVIQQDYNSNFVKTLRSSGGADAYVPTTTLYSGFFDEIVEPQQGRNASAYLGDARGVGVTNIEVQSVCAGKLAGSFYGHAEMLFNPVTAAMVADALSHAGPGKLSRVKLAEVCADYIAPGLTLEDAISTSGEIVIAAIRLLAYMPKLLVEPGVKAYALKERHYI
ncbi:hypothetical protein F5Y03DRAFT_380245 [Xylaria venustula]|nr:hypothetical protein F5Y03DRAFT_380245 [Xylaria venustula]